MTSSFFYALSLLKKRCILSCYPFRDIEGTLSINDGTNEYQ